jgi:gluconate 2-dehydrogenase gamma chain
VLFLPVSRREFIKIGAAGAIGFGIASAIEIPIFEQQLSSKNSEVKSLQSEVTSSSQTFLTLSSNEQKEVEAIVETIIPTDSNGAGAKEAGVIFFIDHQLAGDYGNNAKMYMKGPFVPAGKTGQITVDGITYSEGTATQIYSGPEYQYNMSLREFWRTGLLALETYTNSAYGKNFEDLTATQQNQALTDLYDNKPTSFSNIVPKDFFSEVMFMAWSGFLMDPAYGGNSGKVGWTLTGFTGADMGDTFNNGRQVMQLMVASKPTRFPSHSLGEFQKASGKM